MSTAAVCLIPEPDAPEVPAVPEAPSAPGFDDLGLPRDLLAAVHSAGFRTPTPIQAKAIPALLSGRDVVGLAPTGTGKTAAFGLPILAAVDPTDAAVQALVLTPTRELALQVATAIAGFAAGGSSAGASSAGASSVGGSSAGRSSAAGVAVTAIYGGAPIGPQIGALRRGSPIVVGTPGRVIDHLQRGTLDLGSVGTVVLDEADEMLRMGFAEDIDVILAALPAGRRTALFSATMPPAIRSIAARHLTNPIDVTVAAPTTTTSSVRQQYAVVPSGDRTPTLVRILSTRESGATIVFVRTRAGCQELGAELAAHGIAAAAISGDIAQAERERIIERLRDGRLRVLVATDVAARGLDVDRIDQVVNVGAPTDPESYVHRIGRTGRAGRSGEALTLVTPREIARIRTIEKVTGIRMTEIVPPTAADVVAHRSATLLSAAVAHLGSTDLARHRAAVAEAITRDGVDPTDLAAALVALAAGDYPSAEQEAAAKAGSVRSRRSTGPADDESPARAGSVRSRRSTATTWGDPRREDADPRRDRQWPADRQRPADREWPADRQRSGDRRDAQAAAPVYRIDVGRSHGVRPAAIVGAITGEGGMTGKDVGRIDIYDTYSTVEITAAVTPGAWERISRAKVSGRALKLRRDRVFGGDREPRRIDRARPDQGRSSERHRGHDGRDSRDGHDSRRQLRTAPAGPRRRG